MSLGLLQLSGPPDQAGFADFDEDDAVKLVEQLRVIRGEAKVSPAKGLKALLKGAGVGGNGSDEDDEDEDIGTPGVDQGAEDLGLSDLMDEDALV